MARPSSSIRRSRVQRRMVNRHERRPGAAPAAPHVALHVEEVDRTLRLPHCAIDAWPRRAATPGLGAATAAVAVGRRVAPEHPARLEHAHAARLAREVALQHRDQAADQAGTHHRQRAGDRVEHADRVGVASQFPLPAFLDEAEVDGFLVAPAGQRVALALATVALARTCAVTTGGGAGRAACRSRRCGDFLDQVFLDLQVETPTAASR